jgi:hypothetical protein
MALATSSIEGSTKTVFNEMVERRQLDVLTR